MFPWYKTLTFVQYKLGISLLVFKCWYTVWLTSVCLAVSYFPVCCIIMKHFVTVIAVVSRNRRWKTLLDGTKSYTWIIDSAPNLVSRSQNLYTWYLKWTELQTALLSLVFVDRKCCKCFLKMVIPFQIMRGQIWPSPV